MLALNIGFCLISICGWVKPIPPAGPHVPVCLKHTIWWPRVVNKQLRPRGLNVSSRAVFFLFSETQKKITLKGPHGCVLRVKTQQSDQWRGFCAQEAHGN